METREKIKGAVDNMANKAHQTGAAMTERAKQGVDQAAGITEKIGEKAHDVASAMGEYAKEAGESVSRMASGAADSMVHAKDAVVDWTADAVQHPGATLKACTEQTGNLIRTYPIASLLVGIGIGFVLAKVVRV
jgi:ElaB/YqjD/DUF883 family membrane-anchored ribosome-binding protein